MRDTLRTFFKAWDGTPRTAPPVCGTIDQDLASTVQGNWFETPDSTFSPEDPNLALVHDNFDPSIPVFSVGTTLAGLPGGAYQFVPSAGTTSQVNRDFGLVTDTGIYCYENLTDGSTAVANTVILLQRTDPDTLTIEKQSASNCAALATPWAFSSPITYTR